MEGVSLEGFENLFAIDPPKILFLKFPNFSPRDPSKIWLWFPQKKFSLWIHGGGLIWGGVKIVLMDPSKELAVKFPNFIPWDPLKFGCEFLRKTFG